MAGQLRQLVAIAERIRTEPRDRVQLPGAVTRDLSAV